MTLRTVALLAFVPLTMVAADDSPQSQAWTQIHEGVASTKWLTRQQAAASLSATAPSGEPVRLLISLLEDRTPDVRQTAAAALGQLKARAALPALKKAMDDEDPGVAFFAVRALWDMGDLSGREDLEEILGKERAPAVGGVQGAVRSMKKKMENPKEVALMGARIASGFVLGPFGIGVTASMELLKDSGAAARAVSAEMLAEHCTAESRKVLEARLAAESSEAVKTAIARALGSCNDPASIPMLAAYLNDSRDSIRLMSAASIVRLSEKPAPRGRNPKKTR
ncbi:MAG TPA: HEAT repeat domain-containing protein [Bryobacteraceae bacterium]|nr:HEAT repeat domain-containing protein [Bryobacteraceae bacterium]